MSSTPRPGITAPARTAPSAAGSTTTSDSMLHDLTGVVTGSVRLVLQAEGLAVLLVAVLLYRQSGYGWGLFAALFLVPDVSFIAYLAGPRAGAIAYNAFHSYVGPLAMVLMALSLPSAAAMPFVYIWTAHIGFDRLMRYGLKYASDFHHTHLGSKGRRS